MNKKVVISVISDLVTDQRVDKVAATLTQWGFDVVVIGAKRKKSKTLPVRNYATKRISLVFQRGFSMYAEWNVRLFFKLFFYKPEILLANDLDTLLPNFLHAKLRKKKLVYDSHEYFTEQEEVYNRKFVKKVWTRLEEFIFPKLKHVYTVNASIASIYQNKYHVPVAVVRNVPMKQSKSIEESYMLPEELIDKKILITQGTGINANRGYEELILAMHHVSNDFVLCVVGTGLVIDDLKKLAAKENLEKKIFFQDVLAPTDLKALTSKAFCGFTLDKPTCLNYVYSLPNKLFNFIHAGIPVIGSTLPEVQTIIQKYTVGLVIEQVTPEQIAAAVKQLDTDQNAYTTYKANTQKAIPELCWEKDALVLKEFFV